MPIQDVYKYESGALKNENTLLIKTEDGKELQIKQLAKVPDNHALFNTHGMYYKEFPSDFAKVRAYTSYIIQYAPDLYKEINLLEQQISEIVKNGIEHGNKMDKNKKIRVWFDFNKRAKVIIEDEGPGLQVLDEWNRFALNRTICLVNQDFDRFTDFVAWKGPDSTEMDGGNALFAALEFWNGGFLYSQKGNKCVAVRYFPDNAEYRKYV
jgi:serine/threonine-protein kinase RsbW